MARGVERRRQDVSCTITTRAGNPCRLVPRWRCAECGTICCGIHVARDGRQTHCPVCRALPIEIERRRGDRRKAVDMSVAVPGGLDAAPQNDRRVEKRSA
jgi:hypothetical protein